MGKKKRQKKVIVSYIYEGEREEIFLKYLTEIYESDAKPLTMFSKRGGSADSIISNTLKALDRGTYLFVVLDEDFEQKDPLSIKTLRALEKVWCLKASSLNKVPYRNLNSYNIKQRKPIIVFSTPHSIEGILLQILNVPKKDLENSNTDRLKDRLNGCCHAKFDADFLKERFSKAVIEDKRTVIPELDLIISLMEKAKKS